MARKSFTPERIVSKLRQIETKHRINSLSRRERGAFTVLHFGGTPGALQHRRQKRV